MDRAGRVVSTVGSAEATALANPALAPDGRRVAVDRIVQDNRDVWLIDVSSGATNRFTFDQAVDGFPVWSSDGRRIIFRSNRIGQSINDLFEKPADGASDEQQLFATKTTNKTPLDMSPDGRFLLYEETNSKTSADLWALPLVGEHTPRPVVHTSANEADDGRFLMNVSVEGTTESPIAIVLNWEAALKK